MSDEGVYLLLPRTAVFALRSDPPLPTTRSGGKGARRPAHAAGILIAGFLRRDGAALKGSALGQSQFTGAVMTSAYLGQRRRCERTDQSARSSYLSWTHSSRPRDFLLNDQTRTAALPTAEFLAIQKLRPSSYPLVVQCTRSPMSPVLFLPGGTNDTVFQ